MSELISYAWLEANGFGRIRNDNGIVQRSIGWELVSDADRYLQQPEDLCLALAPTADPGRWHCWVGKADLPAAPMRTLVHIRYLSHVDELKRLYEGLTGRAWSPGQPDELGEPLPV